MADTPHRHLVVVATGDTALRETWAGRAAGRGYGVAFCDGVAEGGAKWPALAGWLAAQPQAWQRCDSLWLPDATVDAPAEAIETLFATMARHGLWLAQPALAWHSAFSQVITLHNAAFTLRTTSFVDAALPALQREFLEAVLPTLALATTGHGLGWLWPALAARGRCGVVDAAQVALAAAAAAPQPERPLLELLAAQGVGELQQLNWGGVGLGGELLSLFDDSRDQFLGRLLAGYAGNVADPAALGATYLMHWQRSGAAPATPPTTPPTIARPAARPALRRSPIVAA